MLVYSNILSLLDYRTAFPLACQSLDLSPLGTPSRVRSPKHISDRVTPLLKTAHLPLIGPKTSWWSLIRLNVHRPLLISEIVFLISSLPQPSHYVAIIQNFSGFRESVMLSLNNIPLHGLFPLLRILEYLSLSFAPQPTVTLGVS